MENIIHRTQANRLEAELSPITEQAQKLDATILYQEELKKRVFGQMTGELDIPDNFNDESDEINEMFYGK